MFVGAKSDREDLESLNNESLDEEIADLAGRIAAATCRWLLLIAEFDRREAHEEWGFVSSAAWLAWRCSLAARSAREHVRVARALPGLPLVREAMARGDLSYSKVRVLTRVATSEVEADLVEMARHATAAQLERIAGSYRRVLNAADAERVHERRFLSFDWEEDGSLSITGSLAPEDGVLFLRALEAGRERLREGSGSPPLAEGGSAEPLPQREPVNADALVLMAETLLAGDPDPRTGGERTQIVVHVDEPVLSGKDEDAVELPARCELEEGARISAETARRLACDASRVTIVEGDDGPLNVGRRTRTIPAATRRAVDSRDRTCRFPGCTNRRWTDQHHIVPWAQGGETSAENLARLCRPHHRLVHEGGFRVDRGPDAELRFWRPDGSLVEESPPLRARRLRGASRRPRQLPRVRGSVFPRSAGESFDLGLAVSLLADETAREPRGP